MKRLVVFITGLVFLWYFGTIIYSLYPYKIKSSVVKKVFKTAKLDIGLGALFHMPGSLSKKSVSYRFYERGKWQNQQELLQPLFNEYIEFGNLAALKHCRLDANLIYKIYTICEAHGMEQAQKSSDYNEFITHIFAFHKTESIPDSLDISYYHINNDNTSRLLLNFKSTP